MLGDCIKRALFHIFIGCHIFSEAIGNAAAFINGEYLEVLCSNQYQADIGRNHLALYIMIFSWGLVFGYYVLCWVISYSFLFYKGIDTINRWPDLALKLP
jgi:hypothetical protein